MSICNPTDLKDPVWARDFKIAHFRAENIDFFAFFSHTGPLMHSKLLSNSGFWHFIYVLDKSNTNKSDALTVWQIRMYTSTEPLTKNNHNKKSTHNLFSQGNFLTFTFGLVVAIWFWLFTNHHVSKERRFSALNKGLILYSGGRSVCQISPIHTWNTSWFYVTIVDL